MNRPVAFTRRRCVDLNCVSCLVGGTSLHAKPISVVMKSISYDPKSVEVPVGGSIVWTNKAFTNHTATSETTARPSILGRSSQTKARTQ